MGKGVRATAASGKTSEPDVVCVDLFCGAGGLTHGLLSAGVRVAAGVDFDDACEHPYIANHKDVAFHKYDVAELEASEVESWFGDGAVRVLAGCALLIPAPS
jgi:DNA (cytosine-5)-methyltransferase 1